MHAIVNGQRRAFEFSGAQKRALIEAGYTGALSDATSDATAEAFLRRGIARRGRDGKVRLNNTGMKLRAQARANAGVS